MRGRVEYFYTSEIHIPTRANNWKKQNLIQVEGFFIEMKLRKRKWQYFFPAQQSLITDKTLDKTHLGAKTTCVANSNYVWFSSFLDAKLEVGPGRWIIKNIWYFKNFTCGTEMIKTSDSLNSKAVMWMELIWLDKFHRRYYKKLPWECW